MSSDIKMKNNLAFSLIELSIVLIIISLLTASIVGGNSLIESARIRSFQNEIHDYKTQFLAFRGVYDRYPGDWDNKGFIGWCCGNGCPGVTDSSVCIAKEEHDFGGEYAGINFKENAQPWVELYLSGIGKFKPKKDTTTDTKWNSGDIFFPRLKSFGGSFGTINIVTIQTIMNSNHWIRKGFSNNTAFQMAGPQDNMLNPKILKKIDLKFDDGLALTGKIRGECYYSNSGERGYDYMIDRNAGCGYLFYYLDI